MTVPALTLTASSPQRQHNVWRRYEWELGTDRNGKCSCSTSIENETSRFNLKELRRNRLFIDESSYIIWMMHRLLSLPPPVHLGLRFTATGLIDQC